MKKIESKKPAAGLPPDYGKLLADIKARVRSAQLAAFHAANKELVALYWDIGKIIDSRQEAGARGDKVVKKLAEDLQFEFPGVAGFSWRNLFYMSEFYVAYRDLPKLHPLVAIIGWTNNLIRARTLPSVSFSAWKNAGPSWSTPCARRRSLSALPHTASPNNSRRNSAANCRPRRKSANFWRT